MSLKESIFNFLLVRKAELIFDPKNYQYIFRFFGLFKEGLFYGKLYYDPCLKQRGSLNTLKLLDITYLGN